jgi:hypothetical protein
MLAYEQIVETLYKILAGVRVRFQFWRILKITFVAFTNYVNSDMYIATSCINVSI